MKTARVFFVGFVDVLLYFSQFTLPPLPGYHLRTPCVLEKKPGGRGENNPNEFHWAGKGKEGGEGGVGAGAPGGVHLHGLGVDGGVDHHPRAAPQLCVGRTGRPGPPHPHDMLRGGPRVRPGERLVQGAKDFPDGAPLELSSVRIYFRTIIVEDNWVCIVSTRGGGGRIGKIPAFMSALAVIKKQASASAGLDH